MNRVIKLKPLVSSILLVCGMSATSQFAIAQLEEIIVTSQKRDENIQKVPIAITAITSDSLEKSVITGTDDLSIVIPNLQYGRQLSSATPFMRGLGTKNSSVGDEGSISTYVDGVYYSSMVVSVMEFNNIERVEVLRGPQGTLFGRNATGGLIHVITKDPDFDTAGKIKLGLGNYDTVEGGFYGTTGITDNIAIDLSLTYKDREDGYGKNLYTGKLREGEEQESARTKLLFDISETTSLTLSYLYAKSYSDVGIARQQAPGVLGAGGAVNTGDFQNINADNIPRAGGKQNSTAVKFFHEFDNVEMISTSSYYTNDAFVFLDQEGGPAQVFNFNLDTEESQFSQEIQFNSTGSGPLEWTAGLYFLDAKAEYTDRTHVNVGPTIIQFPVSQDTKSYAIYAQSAYEITDETKVSIGSRWTKDERKFNGSTIVNGTNLPTVSDKKSWEEPTWRLAIDHQISVDTLAYASYSRGFKSGVYNTVMINGQLPDPVAPEILDAYEIGIKSDYLNHSLRINASMFYYEVEDLQMQLIQGGAIFLFNVGDTKMLGGEVETTYFFSDNFDVNLSASVLDTEYTSFDNGPVLTNNPAGGNITTFTDLSGNTLVRAPDYTISLSTNYRKQTPLGEANFNLTYYYNDGFYWEPDNRLEQGDYELLSAEIGLTSNDEKWRLRVFGRNLLDTDYSTYSQESSTGDLISAAPPRTYGMTIEYRF